MQYWLIKSDPDTYSWDNLLKEKSALWTGVRNYQARNNLLRMKAGEKLLFYHSQTGKVIVGIAQLTKEAFQDPTTDDKRWICVELRPLETFKKPLNLESIKKIDKLKNLQLLTQARLSVMQVTDDEYHTIIELTR
jgi:predicted RNA-binding protein with PUA-like domain